MAAPSYQFKALLGSTDPAGDILTLIESNLTTAGWVFIEETAFLQASTGRVMRVWKNPSTLNAAGTDVYVGFVKNGFPGTYLAMRAFEGYTTASHTMQRPCLSGQSPNTSWKAITYGGGQFVAVSDYTGSAGVGCAATSPDGVTWTSRNLPAGSQWCGVTYGNGMYVAVANNANTVASSPDGITWTARANGTVTGWAAIAYGNGTFVTVPNDASAAVATSPDGITWTNRASQLGTLPYTAVAYGAGLWVAVNQNASNTTVKNTGNMVTSADNGVTWTGRASGLAVGLSAVAYGNGKFVCLPNTGTQGISSADAANWSVVTVPAGNYTSVTYGASAGMWVANNLSGQAAYSADATTWNYANLNAPAYGVAAGAGVFVSVTPTSGQTRQISIPGNAQWFGGGMPPLASGVTNWSAAGGSTPQQIDTAAGLAASTSYDVGVLASKSYVAIVCNTGGTGTQVFSWILGLFNPAYSDAQATTPPLMALSVPMPPQVSFSGVSRALRAGWDSYAYTITAFPESLLLGQFNNGGIKEPVSGTIRGSRVALAAHTAIGFTTAGFRGWLYDVIAVATTGINTVKANDTITIGSTTYTAIGQMAVGAGYISPTYANSQGVALFANTTAGS